MPPEPVVLRQACLISRKGISRVGEVVALGDREAAIEGLEGLFPGTEVKLQLELPLRKAQISIDATVDREEPGGAPGAPAVSWLRFATVPESLRDDLEQLRELERVEADGGEAVLVAPGVPRHIGGRFEVRSPLQDDEAWDNFEGTDRASGQPVLVRCLKNRAHGDERWLERLRESAVRSRSIQHPNLSRLIDYSEFEERILVVSELARAPRLTTVLTSRGPLHPGIVLKLARQTCSALEAVHARDLVYGGLHPGRVRVGAGINAHVTDVGLAAALPLSAIGADDHPLVYAAPEVRRGATPDPRSEVFAVGMLVHAMIVGGPPYPDPGALRTDSSLRPTDLPAGTLASMPQGLGGIVRKATADDPDERFASVEEVGLALNRLGTPGAEVSREESRRILVVDDEADIRNLVRSILQSAGHDVTLAENGMQGLELAFGQPFDLICLDIKMPVMDGIEMCMVLRNDPRTREVPVLVITAYDTPEQRAFMGSLGHAPLLAKPFNVGSLLEKVNQALAGPG